MAKVELDDDGLPVVGSRNPEGMFNARWSQETWDMIGQLREVWGKEKGVRLNNKDVVLSCIVRAYKAKLKDCGAENVNDLPDIPLTPIEQLEERIKANHEKEPKQKKGRKNVANRKASKGTAE